MTYVSGSRTWVEDIYTYGGKSALIQTNGFSSLSNEETNYLNMQNNDKKRSANSIKALVQSINDKCTGNRLRVALDEDKITYKSKSELADQLPNCEIIDSADLFRLIRAVKTEDENNSNEVSS